MSAGDRRYWRSFDQLADREEFRRLVEREFVDEAGDSPLRVGRRDVLTLLAASLSLAGIGACRRPEEHIVPYVRAPEQIVPGVPRYYATTMPLGHSAYGLVVESHEGRPTKIEGNELHPRTLGASGVPMQASILELYDPDRSAGVTRAGQPAEWSEFESEWRTLWNEHAADGGQGLALLTRPFSSPTRARLLDALRRRFPRARIAHYEPLGQDNLQEGVRRATGRVYQPCHHIERADRILSLDCDFLGSDPECVAHTRGFASGRRRGSAGDVMNRLYVVESGYSLTGANADHRLRLRSGAIGALVAALARELRSQGLAIEAVAERPLPDGIERDWLAAVAADLLEHAPGCLILAGVGQPAAVHAATLALNAALGAVGHTVSYHEFEDAALSDVQALASLAAAMREGAVRTLVIVEGNPVYDAPVDLDFAGGLAEVEHSIHLSLRRDETSLACEWHLPRSHYLESWDDCRAVGGTLGVVQPLIAPLFDTRSSVEMLALLHSGEPRSGYESVRETWAERLAPDFERRWNRTLHDGLLTASELPSVPLTVPAGTLTHACADAEPPAAEASEIVFRCAPGVHDGRFANNAWLQELPDPLTKLTWGNAALLSPATARALGVDNGDTVLLSHRGRELELPAWLVPGQADDSVSLWLGYGRRAAGRVGNGVGANGYLLRTSQAPGFDLGVRIEKTGSRESMASTQDHGSMADRPIVREATLAEFREHPGFASEAVEHPPLEQIMEEPSYEDGPQWGMSIDLNSCVGCNACIVACQSENNVPVVGAEQVRNGREMHWLRVDRYFVSEEDAAEHDAEPAVVFQPVPCMHCENAPCEQVCPVAATVHDHEGLNVMVYNRCIGTRYCSNNCPYKVRRFNFFNYTNRLPAIVTIAQNPDVTVRSRGVMEKCTYCTQRINAARIDAKLAGRSLADGDIRTACQQACPAEAIVFGDLRDPDSRVASLKREERDYALLAELNNRPRTTFLAKLRNPNPALGST